MLTVDFDRLSIGHGTKVIDVGCGAGRHSFEAYRRGADVVAFDQDAADLNNVDTMFRAMADSGEVPPSAHAEIVVGDALALPYPDRTFDCVIASEILEHVPADSAMIDELIRVLKVGGTLAVTVPRWLPERLCWLLSDAALARLFASAEIACIPSLYEGFSLPAVEAMASGTPIVASRAGALPEVLGPDGDCARLVRPGDADELIRVLAELLVSPGQLHQLGVAGRRRAVEVYSWESVAAQTARVYERAITRQLPVQDSAGAVGEPC